MNTEARDELKNIYNQVRKTHDEGTSFFYGAPDDLTAPKADLFILSTYASDVVEQGEAYNDVVAELEDAIDRLENRAEDAAYSLSDDLRTDSDDPRFAYAHPEWSGDRRVSPQHFFIQSREVFVGETEQGLDEYVAEHFTYRGDADGPALVESWDERSPGWQEAVEEAAEASGVTETLERLYELNEQLAEEAEALQEEIEDELSPASGGFLDRLRGQ